jgi:hypothetical protein
MITTCEKPKKMGKIWKNLPSDSTSDAFLLGRGSETLGEKYNPSLPMLLPIQNGSDRVTSDAD